jgi:hypothetical protein
MNELYDIKFSFEQKAKESIILKYSNRQGGDFNIFSYHWQCFAWAAIIGFLNDKRKPLKTPIADRPFSLNTMRNGNGEKIAFALVCVCVAKSGSLELLKNPHQVIDMINEYANGGFQYIQTMIDKGENSFNDLERVKQEIISRT